MNRSTVSLISRLVVLFIGLALIVSTALAGQSAYASPLAAKKTKTPTPTPTPTATSAPTQSFTPSPTATNSAPAAGVLLYALYYDTYTTNEPEEAFSLINLSGSPVQLSNWQVTDGEGTVTFPSYSFGAGARLWAAKTATTFRTEFGFSPDFEYGGNSDPAVPDMTGATPPTLANTGDDFRLLDASSAIVDAIVYEGGNTASGGWSGAAIYPYTQGFFGEEGQILYRKLDESTGLPVADTNTLADWAQATDDDVLGKKVQYPGWDLEHFFFPLTTAQNASLKYVVAPDNIFDAYLAEINAATSYIYIEGYTFDNAHFADALVAKLQSGVDVKILLEGEPVNGIEDQDKWICQQIEANGGECWYMHTDSATGVHDRYIYQHAKFTIVDGETLLTGSENLNYSSMPADNKSDGTMGNRGAYIITDSSALINHALDIFNHDLDPANHNDVRRWNAGTDSPPLGFIPSHDSGGTSYAVQFPSPLSLSGNFEFEVIQSPENDLRASDALLGMVARAGSGSTVLVEQLYERKYWGPNTSDPATDPNLRLEAYIEAARRGARVRILLDSFYDDPLDPRSNTETCDYVGGVAASESLDLQCLIGDPTGTGIHNKMVLVWDGAQGWTHTGSINGSENSVKNNRELAVQVKSTDGYNYLAQVFNYDWIASGGGPILPTPTPTTLPTNTPTATPTFTATPSGPQHLLISEVFYDTPGTDSNEEWIEIYNPTASSVDLSGYKLGDEETSGGTEGMYQFPAGASIATGQRITVALKATGFFALYGVNPTYEVIDTGAAVPDMNVYSAWSSGTISLANTGDEVLLLNASDTAVDVVTFEVGVYSGVTAHPGVAVGHSIERSPANQDTNDCSTDFVDRTTPTPGS
ncbi:MAG TPA: lamin tail domain-containing protein [Anaerolineales bacterium]|nr:lamin tail domain-containing protein [Anaerolineales bacterium]